VSDELPEEIRHLPIDPVRQLPVPFITPWEDGASHGHPEHDRIAAWTALDPVRKDECIAGRLCALCGKPMGWWIAFLCDVASLEPGGYTIEPPLHERCAEIATTWCPFVSRERVPRRPHDPRDVLVCPPEALAGADGVAAYKRAYVIAITHNYRTHWQPAVGAPATLVYLIGTPKRVRWFAYRDGRLTEVPEAEGRATREARQAEVGEWMIRSVPEAER
jgi:hypothetical protein